MSSIADLLVSQMITVYFVYGLAFFTLGIALLTTKHRVSEFRFATLMLPLALFGLLHGAHEWFEMFQMIYAANGSSASSLWEGTARIILLSTSFAALLFFAVRLLLPQGSRWPPLVSIALFLVWIAIAAWASFYWNLAGTAIIAASDSLSRYMLAIPASVLAAAALMAEQRRIRQSGATEYGSAMVIGASALLAYGLFGQVFVAPASLPFPAPLTSADFITAFGFPVQLFRTAMAILLTVSVLQVLSALNAEEKRRTHDAMRVRMETQAAALEEARVGRQRYKMVNQELQLATHRLSLLFDISNRLNDRRDWPSPLSDVVQQIVESLAFAEAALIRIEDDTHGLTEVFHSQGGDDDQAQQPDEKWLADARQLSAKCQENVKVCCLHTDGKMFQFSLEEIAEMQQCRSYSSPTVMMAAPLIAQSGAIGSLAVANQWLDEPKLTSADLSLLVGIAQQLGLSVDNALLHTQAIEREQMLAKLLGVVVEAQEGERQRIARELHDSTGQSLTAIAFGLKGLAGSIESREERNNRQDVLEHIEKLQSFSVDAVDELQRLIVDLRPPHLDELGLIAAIRWYCRQYEERWGIKTDFVADCDDKFLSEDVKTVFFRIMQEALTNIARHAQASRADIACRYEHPYAVLTICDDGVGFDPPQEPASDITQSGWGLLGMRERASLVGGQVTIASSPGQGTTVEAMLPVNAPVSSEE